MENIDNTYSLSQDAVQKKKQYSKIIKELKYPLLIIIPIILIQFFTISQFKQFPGPIYGGDIYWHFGETLNIYNGAMPWTNPQVSGEYAYYGWLTQLLIAFIAKITTLNLVSVYMYFPVILTLFVGIVAYALGLEFFGDRKFALLLCFLWIGLRYTVTDIWKIIGYDILMPLLILFVLKSMRTRKIKYNIFAGITLGLLGLTHVSAFPAASVFLFMLFIYKSFFFQFHINFMPKEMKIIFSRNKESSVKSSIKNAIKLFFPMFIIGTAIAMLFFGPIIFVYHGNAVNPLQEYTEPDMSKYGLPMLGSTLSNTFFNLGALLNENILSFIFSVIVLFGLYETIKHREDTEAKVLLILVISAFIAGFHYFFTLPLFGKALIPMYFYDFLMRSGVLLLFVFGISKLHEKIDSKTLFVLLISFFAILSVGMNISDSYNDKWANVGRSEPNPAFSEIAKWVNDNTDKNAVFLSNEELSFALNGLTGRKIMISRRTHFSPYLDIDERIADAYVILYGNDTKKSLELLNEYNVSYLYWDANWLYFAQNEPSLTSLKYEDYLSEYGVRFQKVNTYLDPAWSEYHPKYDVLAIIPANWNQTQPWSDGIQEHLELLKTFYIENKTFAKIFKVEY